jgi:predicted glutamine amidotransferase
MVVVVRFAFDFGRYVTDDLSRVNPAHMNYPTLWYSLGKEYANVEGEWRMNGSYRGADSAIFASEPLTRDTSSWLEIPEYTAMWAARTDQGLEFGLYELDV